MIFDCLMLEALVYYESRNINDFFKDALLLTSRKDDLWQNFNVNFKEKK